MIAQTTIINTDVFHKKAAVHEAMRILSTHTTNQHWVCERCGMIHAAVAPVACDSCGSTTALLQSDLPREMNSRW